MQKSEQTAVDRFIDIFHWIVQRHIHGVPDKLCRLWMNIGKAPENFFSLNTYVTVKEKLSNSFLCARFPPAYKYVVLFKFSAQSPFLISDVRQMTYFSSLIKTCITLAGINALSDKCFCYLSSLLKKSSCLFQLTKSRKCDFCFSPKIKGLTAFGFADIFLYRSRLPKNRVFQQPVSSTQWVER